MAAVIHIYNKQVLRIPPAYHSDNVTKHMFKLLDILKSGLQSMNPLESLCNAKTCCLLVFHMTVTICAALTGSPCPESAFLFVTCSAASACFVFYCHVNKTKINGEPVINGRSLLSRHRH